MIAVFPAPGAPVTMNLRIWSLPSAMAESKSIADCLGGRHDETRSGPISSNDSPPPSEPVHLTPPIEIPTQVARAPDCESLQVAQWVQPAQPNRARIVQ